MFSAGHFLFIGISMLLIIFGMVICLKLRPPMYKLLTACFVVGIVSEFIKIFGKIQIMPVVEPAVQDGQLIYQATGAYAPYLEAEHFPFELCTYQILFILLALLIKNGKWKKRLYAVMYTTCIAGAFMAIVLSSEAPGLTSVSDFVSSVSVWRSFLYHSMLVVLGLYIGLSDECDVHFEDIKWALSAVLLLDFVTFYLNSMMATPYYVGDTLVGVGNVINYFSSYNNPLGIPMSDKSQWFIYLAIRVVLALILITLINLPLLLKKEKRKQHETE